MKLQQKGFAQIGVFALAAAALVFIAGGAGYYSNKAKSLPPEAKKIDQAEFKKGTKFYQKVTSPVQTLKTKKKQMIKLKEGDPCDPKLDWCGTGLKCEIVQQGTVVPTQTGECRLFPPAVHGQIMFTWSSRAKLNEFSQNTDVPLSEIESVVKSTAIGLEVPMDRYLGWLNEGIDSNYKTYFVDSDGELIEITFGQKGEFKMKDMVQGVYSLMMNDLEADADAIYWKLRVNGGPVTETINLYGTLYNANNKINIVGWQAGLPIPERPDIPEEEEG